MDRAYTTYHESGEGISKNSTRGLDVGGGVNAQVRSILALLFYYSLAVLRSLRIRTRREQEWIPTLQYPAGLSLKNPAG